MSEAFAASSATGFVGVELLDPGCLLAFEALCRTFARRKFAEKVQTPLL